nr:hypothetical protein [Sphingobium yanoikuyae]
MILGCLTALLIAGHIEIIASVMAAAEDAGDVRVVELVAVRERVAALIEPFGDGASAHRAVAHTDRGEVDDQPDRAGVALVNKELLLRLRSAHLDSLAFIAKRHGASVEEALLGIPAHGAARMLGRLQREILVERSDEVAQHPAHRVVGEVLGQRVQPDLGALEPRKRLNLGLHAAGKPRQ